MDGSLFPAHWSEVIESDLQLNYSLMKEILIHVHSSGQGWGHGLPHLKEFQASRLL